jgi:hypothetical protein
LIEGQGKNIKRRVSNFAVFTLFLFSCLGTKAQERSNDWYKVDFALLKQTNPESRVLRYETVGKPSKFSQRSHRYTFYPYGQTAPSPAQIFYLPNSESDLRSAIRRIKNSSKVDLLFSGVWNQRLVIDNSPAVIRVAKTVRKERLWGYISLWRTRYTHIEVDLYVSKPLAFPLKSISSWLLSRDPGRIDVGSLLTPNLRKKYSGSKTSNQSGSDKYAHTFIDFNIRRIQQERRIRDNETHYLDHPALGVIASISANN